MNKDLGRHSRIPVALVDDRETWEAYRQLNRSKVRDSGQRTLADIVSVVRYAIGGADEFVPSPTVCVSGSRAGWPCRRLPDAR